jgi:hypothetical protein
MHVKSPARSAAYRKVCLEAHPDKALIGVTEEKERERIQAWARREG